MLQALVGFHCPECVRPVHHRAVRQPANAESVVTKALIGINLAVAVFGAFAGGLGRGQPSQWLYRYGLNGWAVDQGDWYRIVTSGFLHDGLLHLGFNLLALWMIGPFLERRFGPWRYGGLALASLLGGSMGVLLMSPRALTVGASGMVFGLFGAVAVVQRALGIDLCRSGIGSLLAVNLALTLLLPGISVGGHLGGLAVGSVVAALLVGLERIRQPEWFAVGLTVIGSVGLFLGGIWAAGTWASPWF